MKLQLSDEMKADIRKAHCPPGDGEFHLELCGVCAHPQWQMTHLDRPFDVIVGVGDNICQNCRDFGYKHPETFNFVVNAISAQRLFAKYRGDL